MGRPFLIVIAFIAFACKKKDEQVSAPPLFKDSADFFPSKIVKLDLDGDNIKDIEVNGTARYGTTWHEYKFQVSPLNTDVKIHNVQGTQPVCRDSNYYTNFWYYKIYNCSGGAKQISIDSFIYTPNFSKAALATAQVSGIRSDMVLLYKVSSSSQLPYPNGVEKSVSNGFFYASSTGYMLLSIKNKRYGLLIRFAGRYLYFDELVSLD